MKRWLALLLVVLMMFSIAACGGGPKKGNDDPGNNDPGTSDPGTNDPGTSGGKSGAAIKGDFYEFSDMYVLFTTFKEIKFTYTTKSDNSDATSYTFGYIYSGDEVVEYKDFDGVDHSEDTKKYDITIFENGEESFLEVWFNESGDVVKAGSDGDYTVGGMAGLAMFGFAFHIMPFYIYNDGWGDTFSDDRGLDSAGWKVQEHNSVNRNFGSGNVKVERYRISWSWLTASMIYDWEAAEIGGKYLFTKWKWQIGSELMELDTERVIPF